MLEIQEKFSSDGYENVIAEAGSKNLHITEAVDKNNVIGFIAYRKGLGNGFMKGYRETDRQKDIESIKSV